MFQVQEGEGAGEELKCSDGVRAILECPVCLEVGFKCPVCLEVSLSCPLRYGLGFLCLGVFFEMCPVFIEVGYYSLSAFGDNYTYNAETSVTYSKLF